MQQSLRFFGTTFDENERILEEMVLEIGFFHPQYGAIAGRAVYTGPYLTAAVPWLSPPNARRLLALGEAKAHPSHLHPFPLWLFHLRVPEDGRRAGGEQHRLCGAGGGQQAGLQGPSLSKAGLCGWPWGALPGVLVMGWPPSSTRAALHHRAASVPSTAFVQCWVHGQLRALTKGPRPGRPERQYHVGMARTPEASPGPAGALRTGARHSRRGQRSLVGLWTREVDSSLTIGGKRAGM